MSLLRFEFVDTLKRGFKRALLAIA